MGDWRRMTLRNERGTYLDRWGLGVGHWSPGIAIHRITGPDSGRDLHDHPWWFGSLVLWGGYTEERINIREAVPAAADASQWPGVCAPGFENRRRWLSWQVMRLDECHRITALWGKVCWTVVVRGPHRRGWGFYTKDGWIAQGDYRGRRLRDQSNPTTGTYEVDQSSAHRLGGGVRRADSRGVRRGVHRLGNLLRR